MANETEMPIFMEFSLLSFFLHSRLYSLLSLPEFRQSARREGLELALRSIHRQATVF